MLRKRLVSLAVPVTVAIAAFLHAKAVGALVDASLTVPGVAPPASIAAFAEARAAAGSADAFLAHNPFDHTARMSLPEATASEDPLYAPPCDGVRATIAMRGATADRSLAALAVGGRRVVQKGGGEAGDYRIVYVATDRVWLERGGHLCQAPVFAPTVVATPTVAPPTSALEQDVAAKVQKTGPNEFTIDRGALDRVLDAQGDLSRTPLVPEKDGFRLVRVKPGSILATLGLTAGDRLVAINGIEVTSMEKMVEAYAKLRTGSLDRWTIHLVRNEKPLNLDYLIR